MQDYTILSAMVTICLALIKLIKDQQKYKDEVFKQNEAVLSQQMKEIALIRNDLAKLSIHISIIASHSEKTALQIDKIYTYYDNKMDEIIEHIKRK